MKYVIATILSSTAMPLMAHHAEGAAPFHATDPTVTWIVLAALSLGFLAFGLRHCLRGSQD